MERKINLSLQILPTELAKNEMYAAIDAAIQVIQRSGLKFKVTPFETVIEGTYEEAMLVATEAQEAALNAGVEHMMVYIKIQRSKNADVFIEDKLVKYT